MNPHRFVSADNRTLSTLKRVDEKGRLYYLDYLDRYHGLPFEIFQKLFLLNGKACSAFVRRNEKGEVITGRNYDMPHFDRKKEVTGVEVVVRCHGHYESLNCADAWWLKKMMRGIGVGALDDGNCDISALLLLPYFCMDGINEKGLTVSILALEVKEGEKAVYQRKKGCRKIMIAGLLRELLDNCQNIEEAIGLTRTFNLINNAGYDYHLFLSDASGKSAVFEWRYNTFTVTYNDICTNFYTAYDDHSDYCKNGVLREVFSANTDTKIKYRYGFGYSYDNFRILATELDGREKISEEEALGLLKKTARVYDCEGASYTQYSSLYNADKLRASYWVGQDYEHRYDFYIKR